MSASGEDGEEKRPLEACTEGRNAFLLSVVRLALDKATPQGELAGLRWEHVDLTRCIAHLPDTKNGEARTVPLSSAAFAVLRALPRSIRG